MGTLTSPHHRGKKLNLRSLRQFHDLIYHLVNRLPGDHLPALGAVRNPHTGI